MKIIYENDYAIVDNYKFKKDNKTGYYLSGVINDKRIRLHRYIYEKYNGKIPKGYQVHHKDHNKDNNDINNLELLTKKEHLKRHSIELSDELREFYRKNMNEKARPKAVEWHKSKKGKEWHKEQYKISLGKVEPTDMICKYCGKKYKGINHGNNKFCSNKCKSQWRRESGLDDEERRCIECGEKFICNKYSKIKKCYNCTPDRYKKNRKR